MIQKYVFPWGWLNWSKYKYNYRYTCLIHRCSWGRHRRLSSSLASHLRSPRRVILGQPRLNSLLLRCWQNCPPCSHCSQPATVRLPPLPLRLRLLSQSIKPPFIPDTPPIKFKKKRNSLGDVSQNWTLINKKLYILFQIVNAFSIVQ
jgi:hypothetical protein